jgi:uncharacterized protein (TIGR03435 family)
MDLRVETPARVSMRSNKSLKDYIWRAYLVQPDNVVGGPPWIDSERFDINAKVEQPIDDDEVLMAILRTLLEERFQLKLHRESRIGESLILGFTKNGPTLQPGTGTSTITTAMNVSTPQTSP